MKDEKQIVYAPKEVASLLGIEPVTLRNYAKLLEGQGYIFHKNEKNQRGYFDKDIIAFRKFIALKNQSGMTLERATTAIISWIQSENEAHSDMKNGALQNISDRSKEEILKEFQDFKEQQLAFNQELLQQLKGQQKYIEETLNRRDQELLSMFREVQETKKELAMSQQKNGFFSKWFSKSSRR